MVSAGSVCIDRYEVSVWSAPTGGTQYGVGSDDYPCNDNGQGCEIASAGAIYARSQAGVTPSAHITYFQAQQALANVGKQFPTNAEWQQAVAGTPDSSVCNFAPGAAEPAGSNVSCESNWGANDMVGNLDEWVADWDERATVCTTQPAPYGDDDSCIGSADGDPPFRKIGAMVRGGSFNSGIGGGPFALNAVGVPSGSSSNVGFRGAR